MTRQTLAHPRAALAALLAALLVVAGAYVAEPARAAAGPSISVSPSTDVDPAVANTFTVTGTGFSGAGAASGVYVLLGAQSVWSGGAPLPSDGWVAQAWVRATGIVDGAFSTTLSVPAGTLVAGTAYQVATSAAHALSATDRTMDAFAPVSVVAAPVPSPTGSASPTPTQEPSATPTATPTQDPTPTQEPSPTPTQSPAPTPSPTSSPSPTPTSTQEPSPTPTSSPSPTPTPAATPTLSVSQTTGLAPAGQTITVTGRGYAASAASLYTPGKAGVYAQVGWLSSTWRPSEGAASSARSNAYSTWISDAANTYAPTKWTDNGDGTADFTWTVTIDQQTLNAKKLAGATLAVFTTGAGGIVQAANERSVTLSFAEPVTAGSLSWAVSSSFTSYVTGPIANGAIATSGAVTRSGSVFTFAQADGGTFDPGTGLGTARYSGSIRYTGHHGALDVTVADPEVTVTSATSATVYVTTGSGRVDLATVDLSGATRTVSGDAVTYTAAPTQLTANGRAQVFGGSSTTLDPLTVTLLRATPTTTPTPNPTPTPTPAVPAVTPPTGDTTSAVTVAGGSMRWAVSSSYASYVTGPIANGSISTSGGATRSGGAFQFGQAPGSTYDPASGTGTVSYAGGVRFWGHRGAMDVTVADPQVRITAAGAATLWVTSAGQQVAFATLDLGAGTKSTATGAVTYAGVPASLTADGVARVFGGYSTTLDPVTFTIGAPAAAPAGSVGTVAAAAAKKAAPSIPATPPATTGITADAASLAALGSGAEATVSATGFQPGETGIQVVVYSTPTLLATISADAAGTATWTGTLPATLEDGEHTLTFQGTVSRGIAFTLARAATAVGACTVEGATLGWGFKESFRTYIEGIAAGGWTLADVAYAYPQFTWANGHGSVDESLRTGLVTYGGSIQFTGHSGALDTTLSNLRLELAGDVGYLVLDVAGTTQSGDRVAQQGVRFGQFSLPDLEVTDRGLVLDALPVTLTDAGAAAFGTYQAGSALDPVSAVLPVAATCGAAPGPAAPADAPVAEAETGVATAAAASAPVWPWAVGGAALAVVIAAAAAIVIARRRRAHSVGGDGS